MALKLMYLTSDPAVAEIAQNSGVDRIFFDIELLDKQKRQGHLDTVISHNNIEDIVKLRKVLHKSELLVRVNHIYDDSKKEIDRVIDYGADIVMLPYFKTADEVSRFISYVDGKAKVCLLLETIEAVNCLDEILNIPGIDEIHIGLNDLHLCCNMSFMFQLLADGTVERLMKAIQKAGIPCGFGGVGRPEGKKDQNMLAPENIIKEHVRLHSSMVIMSRAFCAAKNIADMDELRKTFETGVASIRNIEKIASEMTETEMNENKRIVQHQVAAIVEKIKAQKGI